MQIETRNEMLKRIAAELTSVASKTGSDLTGERIVSLLEQSLKALQPDDADKLLQLTDLTLAGASQYRRPDVTVIPMRSSPVCRMTRRASTSPRRSPREGSSSR